MNYYWGFANDFSDEFDDSDVLEHHGIKNMSWGERHGPPYPLAPSASRMIRSGRKISKKEARHKKTLERIDKSVEKANKAKASGDVSKMERANEHTRRLIAKSERQKASLERAKAKDERIRSKYNAEKAKYDEAKAKADEEKAKADAAEDERILRVGSADEVLARRERYTPNQLQDAINRIQKETTLKDLKLQSMKTRLDDARGFADSIVNTAGTVINAYSKYKGLAEMINDIAGEDKLPVPGKGKKFQEKANKEAIQKAIKSGDAKLIDKYRDQMTNQELKDAAARVDLNKLFAAGEYEETARYGQKGNKKQKNKNKDSDSSDNKKDNNNNKVDVVDALKDVLTSDKGKDNTSNERKGESKAQENKNKSKEQIEQEKAVDSFENAWRTLAERDKDSAKSIDDGKDFIYDWSKRRNGVTDTNTDELIVQVANEGEKFVYNWLERKNK